MSYAVDISQDHCNYNHSPLVDHMTASEVTTHMCTYKADTNYLLSDVLKLNPVIYY